MSTATSCKIDIGRLEGKENWSTWRCKVLLLLRGSPGGLDAINGKLKEPVQPDTTASLDDFAKYEKELQRYNEIDSAAMLILMANMSDVTLQKVMRLKTAKKVWDELHTLFDGTSEDKSYILCYSFFGYSKDSSHDMSMHISKLKQLWHELKEELRKGEEKCDLPEILLICKILETLPDESYFSFKSSWMLMSKKDRNIDNLTAQICAYERSLTTKEENTEALIAQSHKNIKVKKKCGYCGIFGHKVRKCHKWISDGKPPKPPKPSTSQIRDTNMTIALMQVKTNEAVNMIEGDLDNWYVDNGATSHVTGRNDIFSSFQYFNNNQTVTTANGSTTQAIGKGTVDLIAEVNGRQEKIRLFDVWYVPEIRRNLFSVLAAQDKLENSVFISERESCLLKVKDKIYFIGKRVKNGGLYKLNAQAIRNVTPELNTLSTENILQLYHERLAHQNKRHVKEIIEKEFGIKVKLDSELCTGCVYGKAHRRKFGTRERTKAPGEIIHTDVCGPFPNSFKKFRYFVLFKDDYSKYRQVYFIKHKYEVKEKLVQMIKETKNAGHEIKTILSDNGGEFNNEAVRKVLESNGILQRLTMPYTPEQNGCSERENRTLVEAARTMMHAHEELPLACWSELINTAAYILNRTGPTTVEGKSPFELWFGKKPEIKHLRVIGTECFAHIPKQRRTKLSKKTKKCILIGYDGDDGYRLLSYENGSATLIRSRDVTFNESIIRSIGLESDVDTTNEENSATDIEIYFPMTNENHPVFDAREDVSRDEGIASMPQIPNDVPIPSSGEDIQSSSNDVNDIPNIEDEYYVTPEDSDNEQASSEETHNTRVLRDRSALRRPVRFEDFIMSAIVNEGEEPKTYKQALKSLHNAKWLEAMENEMKSLKENNTWILVDRPKDRKLISCKWLFKIKTNADGSLDKYKARLVARGYTQEEGVDYYDTFSPVARMTTIRSILSIAANEGLTLSQFDVVTAFLNGLLDEDIYMSQPEGFSDGTNKVCKLKRSLYGLKQSPRCWNKCIVDYLKTIEFKQCVTDPCLFIRNRRGNKIILALYVDDGLIASTNQKDAVELMAELKQKFKITTKPASHFLGLEIYKDNDGSISVSQKHYAQKILERFGMSDCKPVSTPIIKEEAQPDTKKDNDHKFPYREAVGALAYLMTGTRPDISYAISVVSRSLTNPSSQDIHKVKRILRYIKGTLDCTIVYKKGYKHGILECFSDSDHGGDKTTGRSTSGIICMYAGGVISWASRKQSSVAISSTEAELVAASEAAREIVWLKRLFNEVTKLNETPSLQIDNDAAIKLSQNPELHRRTKHIAIRHFYVRELVTNNELTVKYVPTEYQCADILTKPVHKPRLKQISNMIGLMV